uniref:hypothetical protein n=1 Tax=Ruminococcus sp. TaxID=41978 RepID=UPI00388DEB6D
MATYTVHNNWDNYHWANEQTQHNYEQAVAEDQWDANFAENQRQYNETMAQNQRQFEAEQAEKQRQYDQTYNFNKLKDDYESRLNAATASNGLSQNYSNIRNKIVSQSEFNKSRRLSNSYQSYKAYVKSMIDNAGNLTDAEIAQLILDYDL